MIVFQLVLTQRVSPVYPTIEGLLQVQPSLLLKIRWGLCGLVLSMGFTDTMVTPTRFLEIKKILYLIDLRLKQIVFNASEKLLVKATQMIDKNQTVDKINVGAGIQQIEPRELDSSDLKNLADTIVE